MSGYDVPMTAAMPDDGAEEDLIGSSVEPYVRNPRGGSPEGDDPRRCTGHLSDGSGERCRRWAIEGGNVCPTHGGSRQSVKRTAQLRLLDLVPAATKKHKEILDNPVDQRVALKAIEMVYDRTGLEAKAGIGDVTVVREMVVGRLLSLRGEQPVGPPPEDDVIWDAEVVDEEEGLTAEDLI